MHFVGHLIDKMTEIVRYYGSDCTTSALQNNYARNLAPNIKALKQAVDNGQDPKEVVLMEGVRSAGGGKRQKFFFLFSLGTLRIS